MASEKHFPFRHDYSNYEYFRVSVKNIVEFRTLYNSMKEDAMSGKKVSAKSILRYFSLMKEVQRQETIHYIQEASDIENEILKHFQGKQSEDYTFEPEMGLFDNKTRKFVDGHVKESKWIVEHTRYNGFDLMIFVVVYNLLTIDRDLKKPFTKDECIKTTLVEVLKYRKDQMSPKIKEVYGLYKSAVLAACIADKAFDFRKPVEKIEGKDQMKTKNSDYFQYARTAIKLAKADPKCSELFKNIGD